MVSGFDGSPQDAFDQLPIEHRAALASAVLFALGGRGRRFPIASLTEERRGGSDRRSGGNRSSSHDRCNERPEESSRRIIN